MSAGCEVRRGQDILVAQGGSQGNLLRVAERIDGNSVGSIGGKGKAEMPHPKTQGQWESGNACRRVRVRQYCDKEANGNCLRVLELLVALRRARGIGQLKPLLYTEMAMVESQPYMKLRDALERRGEPLSRISNTQGWRPPEPQRQELAQPGGGVESSQTAHW